MMAEAWSLTTPIQPPPTSTYTIRFVAFDWENKVVAIGWRDNKGLAAEHRYTDPAVATQIMVGLNKANLSVKSLQVRAFERLVADGVIGSGAATGAPD